MKDVSLLLVKQFRIFEPDLIPFFALGRKQVTDSFRERFGFREVRPDGAELQFVLGQVERESGEVLTIPEVRIASRRIIVVVEGDSDAADEAFEALRRHLAEHVGSPRLAETDPVIRTEETTCVCSLDIDWADLLANGLGDFQSALLEAASSEEVEASVSNWSFRIQLGYLPKLDRLREYGIDLVNKWFLIEPRANRPLSDRVYYSESPTGSATHLQLLETLESLV